MDVLAPSYPAPECSPSIPFEITYIEPDPPTLTLSPFKEHRQLREAITGAPARTPEGPMAKARVTRSARSVTATAEATSGSNGVAWSLARDVLGEGGRMKEIDYEAIAAAKVLAIPVTPVPLPGTRPYAELVAACAAFGAAERTYLGFFHGPDCIEDDDKLGVALAPNEAEPTRPVRRICGLRATSLESHLARIRVVMLEDLEWDPTEDARSQYINISLLGALLRDVAEHAGARRPV
jgi:hypothetical protein